MPFKFVIIYIFNVNLAYRLYNKNNGSAYVGRFNFFIYIYISVQEFAAIKMDFNLSNGITKLYFNF